MLITEIGTYLTRSGDRVEVTGLDDRSEPEEGYVISGIAYGQKESWTVDGFYYGEGDEDSMDIVSICSDEFTVGAYKTRNGEKAVILKVDGRGDQPLIGYVETDDGDIPEAWNLNGGYYYGSKSKSSEDLISIWVDIPKEVYLEIDNGGTTWSVNKITGSGEGKIYRYILDPNQG